MRIKSYFAQSVEEAVEKARRELGPEAMLVNSKKTELELRSLGAYEVIFAEPPDAAPEAEIQPVRVAAKPAPPNLAKLDLTKLDAADPANDLVRELAELRKQIETVKRSVDRRPTSAANSGVTLGPDGNEMMARLTSADMSEELATELAVAVESRQATQGVSTLEAALRLECEQRLAFAPGLPTSATGQRAVLFVGPAGAGKTTSLIKLALRYGLRARVPLQLLSLDTLRIGGWEQLASYARIAGIPYQPLHTPAATAQAFSEYGQKNLLLIDTPGFAPADEPQNRALAASLAARRESLDVHLVLSAASLPRIQQAAIERFAAFHPSKILFTHLDEVESPGPLLETALRAGLPISFMANGQQVPEDIEEASLDRVLGSLVNRPASPTISRVARSLANRKQNPPAASRTRSRRIAPAA